MTKLEEILKKLPPGVARQVMKNPELLLREKENRETHWPLKNFIPNIAQVRALMPFIEAHESYPGRFPFITIFRAGNGVGKTCLMAILIGGVTLGNAFLNNEYFNHEYFDDCRKLRLKRKLKVRIVCDKVDMQENGSVYQELSKWLPAAKFSGKTSGGYYTEVRIPAPTDDYFETLIDVKTFDMDAVAHAGPDYDLIIFNEPPPQNLYNENIGRCRMGGRVALFLTPIDQAAFLHKVENGDYPDGEIHVTEASIWDNCADIPGTNGRLSKHDIEKMIRQWTQNNPLEVPAREHGKYMYLVGSIFTIFSSNVHVIPPVPIQSNWNIYKIIDPHDRKPPFAIWVAVTPMNNVYVIAEYPEDHWENVTGTYLKITHHVSAFEIIQNGRSPQFTHIRKPLQIGECLGDPNKFADTQPGTGLTMKEEYEAAGCEPIYTKLNDDVAYRHQKIRDLLFYDPLRPVDEVNKPQLFVFKSCRNMIQALKNHRFSESQGLGAGLSNKVDKTWECPIACLGYFAVHFSGYDSSMSGMFADDAFNVDQSKEKRYINGGYNCNERFI